MPREETSRWFCKYLAQFNGQLDYNKLPQHRKDTYKMMVEEDIMPYLHSQGVVIKVGKPFRIGESVNADGVTAYELLIKE